MTDLIDISYVPEARAATSQAANASWTSPIECAPQDQGGSPINHIHAIYRDPINDYGVKLVG